MAQCNVSDETEGFKPGNKRDTDCLWICTEEIQSPRSMHRSRKLRPALSTSGFVFLRTESQTVSIPLILTGFSVSSVIAFFTLFSLVWNVALRHNQVWQCDSIATLKFNDVSANFWVAILLHCQTLLWRNAKFQTKQKVSSQVINGILTVCESARRKYKALGQCTGLASFDRHYQPRALYFSVQNHKQSVSR